MNKKGNIQSLFPTVMALILVGVLMGAGLMILEKFSISMGGASAAQNATNNTIAAIGDLASTWLPIIVVVIAAGIVLAVLLGAFGGGKRR